MKCKMTKGIKISKKLSDRLNEISKENLNKENSNFKDENLNNSSNFTNKRYYDKQPIILKNYESFINKFLFIFQILEVDIAFLIFRSVFLKD